MGKTISAWLVDLTILDYLILNIVLDSFSLEKLDQILTCDGGEGDQTEENEEKKSMDNSVLHPYFHQIPTPYTLLTPQSHLSIITL